MRYFWGLLLFYAGIKRFHCHTFTLSNMRILFALWLTLFLLSSCRFFESDTKEQYLKDYDAFANEFSTQYPHYSLNDWQAASETFDELANERYYQFESALSYREKLVLNKWAVMFALTRYKDLVQHQVNTEYGSDIETMLNGLREIMDSTYTVYDSFDANMRDLLFKIKPCQ